MEICILRIQGVCQKNIKLEQYHLQHRKSLDIIKCPASLHPSEMPPTPPAPKPEPIGKQKPSTPLNPTPGPSTEPNIKPEASRPNKKSTLQVTTHGVPKRV